MGLLFLVGALLASPQDPPRLTLQKSGTFRALADEISRKIEEKLKVDADLEDKTVELHVRDAGFLEALDALCRAHGAVTYLVDDFRRGKEAEGLVLRSGTWIEYPVSYSGNLKTIVSAFTRVTSLSEKEGRTW